MKFLRQIERWIRPFAIPNLTVVLVFFQAASYFLTLGKTGGQMYLGLCLIPQRVLEGEVWRLLTFMILPPATNFLFAFFALYIFYIMGTALEAEWGTVRYNIFIFIGWLATVATSFAIPNQIGTNAFIGLSVFLAFAHLHPNFVLHVLLILPVQIKWLALLAWIGYGIGVVTGDWWLRAYLLASLANYFIFFGKDIFKRVKHGKRRMDFQSRAVAKGNAPFHVCAVCGITEKTHPQMDFRVCLKCDGALEYCEDHLHNHEHIAAPAASETPDAEKRP